LNRERFSFEVFWPETRCFSEVIMPTLSELRNEYQTLFDSCVIRNEKRAAVESLTTQLLGNKVRYQTVGAQTDVPWYIIAVIHNMESSQRFTRHLHNGDPLTARTVKVPAGRPVAGNPPFTWEASAVDALIFDRMDVVEDWTIPGALFVLERFNGFGSRSHGIKTPYLWSFSTHYSRGKFIRDNEFDPNAVSQQCGAAVLLKRMTAMNAISVPVSITPSTASEVAALGAAVTFSRDNKTIAAVRLQKALNRFPGATVRLTVDGLAGGNTSDAFRVVTGRLLIGDPRA
jgi:lysozyme family protein